MWKTFVITYLFVVLKDLIGVHSAREFVWWYNGHPDCRNLNPDLRSTDTAVIFGQVFLYIMTEPGKYENFCIKLSVN